MNVYYTYDNTTGDAISFAIRALREKYGVISGPYSTP